eukprot:TRINITY_DN8441_c0_g1_i1.p2 TRINITY_DN8441_c0_g1~~TRINITY_DN8441_c0_g1_i1.p2  ORF type:complete len:153 (-),score=4.65 TRINITY_DN8441_c0_g1_i1:181-639(-)
MSQFHCSNLSARYQSTAFKKVCFRQNRIKRSRISRIVVKNIVDVNQENFEAEVLQSPQPVLVDFWADWCGPCKLINPSLKKLEDKYGSVLKVVKMDVDQSKDLVKSYKVYGLPTVLVFRDGQVVEGSHREGAITYDQLVMHAEKYAGIKLQV